MYGTHTYSIRNNNVSPRYRVIKTFTGNYVTTGGVRIGNWIYGSLVTRNYI
jgi:hypothetical protein